MVTRAEAAAYRDAQADVVLLARNDLAAWWSTVDTSDARSVSVSAQAFIPELTAAYGDMSAVVAADYYDQIREQSVAGRPYRAVVAEPAPTAQVQASARWGLGPLFSAEPDARAALNLLAGSVQRYVQLGGRSTLERNVRRDRTRPRWARVPYGAKPCSWCRLLASRGAVYHSARSAGEFNQWHDDCNCQIVATWTGQLPYDVDMYREEYERARDAAASGSIQDILAQLRQDLGVS